MFALMCHVCSRCGGKGTIWNRMTRTVDPCPVCSGSGSALTR
jgi:DnaJ-class molecular chaperone